MEGELGTLLVDKSFERWVGGEAGEHGCVQQEAGEHGCVQHYSRHSH